MAYKLCLPLLCCALLAGCQSGLQSKDVYSHSIKETVTGHLLIEVDARLEQVAKQKTKRLAKKACHERKKKRVIVADQVIAYTHGRKSTYATGYHGAKTHIKCK